MKVVSVLLAVTVMCVFITGCASSMPNGALLTQVKLPVATSDLAAKGPKVGVSECVSYFGLIATGDASIDTAMRQGGITKVHHVDWEVDNLLGLIGKYKCVVYGE